ncbi:MAG: YifB family Mg chelatase-like AAA ATPase [Gammaproteobacteria bacterium]|nr:YifB family Mg chelatase-like AAA ATPase [Gammaproteobacteria bacterium]TVQ44771.1 MAG: ATP-binding protein [Gammaproteobacteria bacterium]
MGLAIVRTRAQVGIASPEVTVEAHAAGGLPGFTLVGLPAAAVREARDRVRAALSTCGFDWPAGRITVHLGPADLPKQGGRFDLPIAVALLAATGQLPARALASLELYGELGLDGRVLGTPGLLPALLAARAAARTAVVPRENAPEAGVAVAVSGTVSGTVCEGGRPGSGPRVIGHLRELCDWLRRRVALPPVPAAPLEPLPRIWPELADVLGQMHAKRALEVAAAGGHNLVLIGPPGSGKSMLAARLPGLLPPLELSEALELAAVRSAAGLTCAGEAFLNRPWRAPHHSASAVALVGGGASARPGEVSLAHHGVLFLDELPEFRRGVLEALREPLENGAITVARALRQADYPTRFQLVAAMNPCPCGYYGDPGGRCSCSPEQVRRYRGRISGPLLDRIDLHVDMPRIDLHGEGLGHGPTTAEVARRVARCRARQRRRQGGLNAGLPASQLAELAVVDRAGRRVLQAAASRRQLSGRAQARILRLALTLADLAVVAADRDDAPTLPLDAHVIAGALALRCLDREDPSH